MGTREEPVTVEMDRITIDYIPYETVTQVDNTLAPGITKIEVYGHSGYKVDTYRVVYGADGKEISRTFEARSTYKKLDELILAGPALSPSPSPSASAGTSPSPSEGASPSPSGTLSPSPSGLPSPSESPEDSPGTSPSPAAPDSPSPSTSALPTA